VKKTGGEIIIDSLISHGIETIFGIPGHGCLGIFDALRDRSRRGLVRYIQVKQEMCGVHMADGFYRASGKPLVMLTSIGAGAVNSLLGVATAYIDSIPVIIITGDAHTHMRGTGILQEFERQQESDFISSARPLAKRCWRVDNAGRVQRIIKHAYNIAMGGRRGLS
jgi:acetolactate synthase-1/2/3 large subunit